MSTRSITVINDEEGKEICVMYRHCDGYPEGHGKDLVDFLKGKKIINGIIDSNNSSFNGMNCLAASVVSHFKIESGDIYLYAVGVRDLGENYIYTVSKVSDDQIKVEVRKSGSKENWVLL